MSYEKDEALSFEEALAHLELLVNRLESGNLPLEESLRIFGEGIKLTQQCGEYLNQAEKQINLLLEDNQEITIIQEEDL